MGISCSSATGFSCFRRWSSIGTFTLLVFSVLLLQLSLVSSVPEDYYNPDYDESNTGAGAVLAGGPGFDAYGNGNWGEFSPGPETDETTEVMKRYLGALASKSARPSFVGLRTHRNDFGLGGDDATFGRFVRSWQSPLFRYAGEKAHSDAAEMPLMKSKRFLGSLARGGWFPRQFRGSADSQVLGQWDKRHVGAAAKLGRLRPVKSSKRDLFDGEYQGGRFAGDR